MSLPKNKYVSIQEAAKILGVSTKTLRRWESSGRLPALRTKGGHRRYDISDLKGGLKPSPQKVKVIVARTFPQTRQPHFPQHITAAENKILPISDVNIYKPIKIDPSQINAIKLFAIYSFGAFLLFITILSSNRLFNTYKNTVASLKMNILASTNLPFHLNTVLGSEKYAFKDEENILAQTASQSQVLAARAGIPTFNVNIESSFNDVADFIKGLNSSDITTGGLTATGAANLTTVNITGPLTGTTALFTGNVTVPSILTNATTFNLANTNATTLNIGGAGTAISIGATSGTTTINNNSSIKGTLTSSGKITGSGDLAISGATSLSGSLTVSGSTALSGNLTKINGVTYSWPSAQGAASSSLQNDGSGNLTWSTSSSGITGSGTSGQVTYFNGTSSITGSTSFTWNNTTGILSSTGLNLTLGSDATGDIYYRNSSGNFARLGIGTSGQTLAVSGGLPAWTGGSGTGSSGFWTRTATTLSPFNSGDNITTTGNVGIGSTSAPTSQLSLNATTQTGTIFNLAYGTLTSLTGDLTGSLFDIDSGNVTATNQNVTGIQVKLPTVTNTITTGTKTLSGFNVNFGTGSGINQNGAGGTTTYNALSATLPALTQTAGTLNVNGLYLTTPSSITTGGTASGVNISATGVAAGSLNGLNISGITAGAGTETAMNIGTGWDSVLTVGATNVINGSGVTQIAGGGTNQSTYTKGDILYSDAANSLAKLPIGTTNYVLTVSAGGIPSWNTISGSSCTNCLVNNPTADQVVAPTGDTTGISVRQTTAVSPTHDIFSVTNSTGLTKYLYVDSTGTVNIPTIGSSASDQLTITPGTDKFALKLVGTNVATNSLQIINPGNTSGTIFNTAYTSAKTLAGSLTGINLDLSTNLTATNQAVTGQQITIPTFTNTNATGTNAYYGIKINPPAAGGINQNGAGASTYTLADLTMPALTQTSGTLTSTGLNLTTPSSITTGGTAYGINVNATGVGAGTLTGLNIGSITAGAGTQTAINIGSGWNNAIVGTTAGTNIISFTNFSVSSAGLGTFGSNVAVNGGSLTTNQTTANLFNSTATTLNIGAGATTALNVGNGNTAFTAINIGSGTGGNTINLAGTGATGNNTINIGTGGTGANTITIGENSSTTSLALTSGTGSQTFTSSVATGTNTTGSFVFNNASLSSGDMIYATASAITSGNMLKLGQGGNQTFSGNGIFMDFDNTGGGGLAFTGNFEQYKNAGTTKFSVDSSGKAGIGLAAGSGSFLNIAAATTSLSQLNLTSSAGTNKSTPVSGDFWWNGTNLYFNNGSANKDLLAGMTGSGTSGQIAFFNGTSTITSETSGFGWDTTNKLLTVSSGTSTGDIISATASAITSGNILKLGQGGNTNFTGNGILMDFDNTGQGGIGFTGNFLQFKNAGAAQFQLTSAGNMQSIAGAKWQPLTDTTTALNIANSTGTNFVTFDSSNQRLGIKATPVQALDVNGSINIAANNSILWGGSSTFGIAQSGGNILVLKSNQVNFTSTGGQNSLQYVTANNLASDSNFLYFLYGNAASAGTQFRSSAQSIYRGSYWNGSAAVNADTAIFNNVSGNNLYQLSFQTGGSTRMAIDQSGNIGINTTSPGAHLDLEDTGTTTGSVMIASASAITSGNILKLGQGGNTNFTGNGILMDFDNTGQGGIGFTGNFVRFQNATTDKFIVDSTGKTSAAGVFTGTSATNTRLQATGATPGSTGNSSIYFLDSSGNTTGRYDTGGKFGTGADGAMTITTATSKCDTAAGDFGTSLCKMNQITGAVTAGQDTVTMNSTTGFTAGDEVLLIQMAGTGAGNYETHIIQNVDSTTVLRFKDPILNAYGSTNAQVARIPQFTDLTINTGITFTPVAAWNGTIGGVFFFRATGTVTINSTAILDMNGLGGGGGAATAGGGGGLPGSGGNSAACPNPGNTGGNNALNGTNGNNGTGPGAGGGGGLGGLGGGGGAGVGAGNGGGGGGAGAGGAGGSYGTAASNGTGGAAGGTGGSGGGSAGTGGTGGTAGSAQGNSSFSTIFMGSGGGSGATGGGGGGGGCSDQAGSPGTGGAGGNSGGGGAGGAGGGILVISGRTVTNSGTIRSNGNNGSNGSAGSVGSNGTTSGTTVAAGGGGGGGAGGGGGGGSGGTIWMISNNLTAGTNTVTGGSGATNSGVNGGNGGTGSVLNPGAGFACGNGSGAGVNGTAGVNAGCTLTSGNAATSPSSAGSAGSAGRTLTTTTANYGTLYAGSLNTVSADLAEYYTTNDMSVEPGDVVSVVPVDVLDDKGNVVKTKGVLAKPDSAYDSKVVGIISTSPGITLGSIDGKSGASDQRALALSGRVPVKIDPDSDPIIIGDFLTSSNKPGYAKKATKAGYTVAKALQTWNHNGDKIEAFVNLGYFMGNLTADGSFDTGNSFIAQDVKISIDQNTLSKLNIPNTSTSNATDSANPSNASGSATISMSQVIASLTDRIQKLETDSLLVKTSIPVASSSGNLSSLTVIGNSVLGDTVINGKLNIGSLSFDNLNNSIDAIGTLKIQPLALGNIELENGQLIIDTNGNINLKKGQIIGNQTFRGNITIKAGTSSVEVPQSWPNIPASITVTPNYNTNVWVTNKTAKGFTINVSTTSSSDQEVDWSAIW